MILRLGLILGNLRNRFPTRSGPLEWSVQRQSGCWDLTGKCPYDRKDGAIRTAKTMAGSQDADLSLISVLPSCAWFLRFWAPFFREPMKEDRNVQYSFSGNRL